MTSSDAVKAATQDLRPVRVGWIDERGSLRTITESAPLAIATNSVVAILSGVPKADAAYSSHDEVWMHASQALAEQHLARVASYVARVLALLEELSPSFVAGLT